MYTAKGLSGRHSEWIFHMLSNFDYPWSP